MSDVDFGDLIDYFGADSHTSSIILYIESITDARKFMSAARHFAKSKPIIVVKSGRTARSALAAASHTGAIAGDDTLYSAVFRRAGVVRVDQIEDLFDASEALSRVSSPRGPHLGIVTNAGGPGVMASDRLLHLGGELAELAPETDEKLKAALPGFAARGNPVDVAGDADAVRYATAAQALMDDPNCDGVLAILTPQAMSDPTGTAQALIEVARSHQLKPLLTSFMGEIKVAEALRILRDAHVPTFGTPEDAVRRLHVHVPVHAQPREPLRDAGRHPPRLRAGPRRGQEDLPERGPRRAQHPERARGQGRARGVPDPRRQDAGRQDGRGVRQGGGGDRLPRGHQDPQPRHHAQERRRRHRPQRPLRPRGGQPVRQDHRPRAARPSRTRPSSASPSRR